MKSKSVLLFFIIGLGFVANCQKLYTRSFGNENSKPVIFLHGGPGYNCANFESTTAKRLSDSGYFVIVYDRRGEGRSVDTSAKYNFKETFDDLNNIYNKYKIKKASLIGHSFGGIVATLYTEKYPEKINSVILVGAPISLQETFRTIIRSTEVIYNQQQDSSGLKKLKEIKRMDTTSAEYYANCFSQAGQNKFYSTKNPSEEMKEIYKKFWKDTLIKQTFKMTIEPPLGFLKNENYTSINLTNNIKKLSNSIKFYALYGKDDGLYSVKQIEQLSDLIGNKKLKYLDDCAHTVFIDQQTLFVSSITEWVK